MSQQFNSNGKPLIGGKVYFYAANTTAPQNAYKDVGLTLPHPNPLPLVGAGRVPEFYLADGNIHFRLVDSTGVVQWESQNALVIGPSSGSGGGGTSVDPNAIFMTGDVLWAEVQGTRAGWVRDNGLTIGSAVSGAGERANADCQALFTYGWTAGWAVVGGKGASAAADWSGNKQITLPDKRGYSPGGLDDMGNTAAGRLTSVPFATGNSTTAGALCGESIHLLSKSEVPALSFSGTTGNDSPDHVHGAPGGGSAGFLTNTGGSLTTQTGGGGGNLPNTLGASVRHQHSFSGTTTDGGGGSHNNTGLRVLGTFFRKL